MRDQTVNRLMQMANSAIDAAFAAWQSAPSDKKHNAFRTYMNKLEALHRLTKHFFPQSPTPPGNPVFQIPPHDQAPVLPAGVEPFDGSEGIHFTKTTAQALSDRLGNMIPTIRASDEHDIRRSASLRRRHAGILLDANETRRDLLDVLDRLESHLMQFRAGANKYMKTPTQVLAYAERAATYALRDYPRHIEGEESDHVAGLWDAIDRIHTNARAWRIGEFKGDGMAQIAAIERITKEALQGIYPDHSDGNEVQS